MRMEILFSFEQQINMKTGFSESFQCFDQELGQHIDTIIIIMILFIIFIITTTVTFALIQLTPKQQKKKFKLIQINRLFEMLPSNRYDIYKSGDKS